jgi:hypothetical protein
MSAATGTKTEIPGTLNSRILSRILEEGYGPGAWHGHDLKAALADVSEETAFWRPAPGRHNIAEIALHHAYSARSVRGQLSGKDPEPFVLKGEDWFDLESNGPLKWKSVRDALENEQRRLASAIAGMGSSKPATSGAGAQQFDLALGITCHAIYHAGQVQLIKRLREE